MRQRPLVVVLLAFFLFGPGLLAVMAQDRVAPAPSAPEKPQAAPAKAPAAVAAPAAPKAPSAPASSGVPAALSPEKTAGAEDRYKAYLEREHQRDAAKIGTVRSKLENKYKGYVRPPKTPKGAAGGADKAAGTVETGKKP